MKQEKIFVVDSSVIVKWVSRRDELLLAEADRLLQDCEHERHTLFAPALSTYEVGNALIKGKGLSPRDVHIALDALFLLPIRFITESADLALTTAHIAETYALTYYDAAFIALAAHLGAPLITDNIRHQGKAKECQVIALAAY